MKKGTITLKVLAITLALSVGSYGQSNPYFEALEVVMRNIELEKELKKSGQIFNEITKKFAEKTETFSRYLPNTTGEVRSEQYEKYTLLDFSEQEFRTQYEYTLTDAIVNKMKNNFENLKEDYNLAKGIKSFDERFRQLKNIRDREMNLCKGQDTPRCAKLKELNDGYDTLMAVLDSQWKLYTQAKQELSEYEAKKAEFEAQKPLMKEWARRIYKSMNTLDYDSLKKGIKLIFKTNNGEIVFGRGIPMPKLEESYNIQGKVIKFMTSPNPMFGEILCVIEGKTMFGLQENKKKGVLEKIYMNSSIYNENMGYMGFGIFDVE